MYRIGNRLILIDDRYICILFLVVTQDVGIIDGSDVVAVGHNDQLRFGFLDVAVNISQRFQSAAVENRFHPSIRRQDGQTAVFAGKVPFFAVSDVVHQRLVITFCNNTNIFYIRIDHVGQHEIHQTVSATKRHRCHCTVFCQFAHHCIVHIGEYNSQCFTQHRRSPPVHPFQSWLLQEPLHSFRYGCPLQ